MKYGTVALAALLVLAIATATAAAAAEHPTMWNSLTANQQATWNRLAPKTWLEMTPAERVEWQTILSIGQPSTTVSTGVPTTPTTIVCTTTAGTVSCASPVAPLPQATVPSARWTADTCAAERDALTLLSARLDRLGTRLQALAVTSPAVSPPPPASPPTYRCTRDTTDTTTCRPEGFPIVNGASAFSETLTRLTDQQAATKRFDVLAAQIQTEQAQFDTQWLQWKSRCTVTP
jgi:hypothetical protein